MTSNCVAFSFYFLMYRSIWYSIEKFLVKNKGSKMVFDLSGLVYVSRLKYCGMTDENT